MAFNLFQNQPIASKSVLPNFAEAYNKPQSLAAKLLEAQLKNKHDSIINQYLPRSEDARINNILANTEGTRSNTGLDSMRRKMMEAQSASLSRENSMKKENPFYGASGDLGKIGALIYIRKHPELFRGGSQENQPSEMQDQPNENQTWMDSLRDNSQSINAPLRLPEKKSASNSNYANDYEKAVLQSLTPKQPVLKQQAYTGPAAEAISLQRLIDQYGEDSPVVKQALDLAAQKSESNAALNDQRKRRAGGLKPGEEWVEDPGTKEKIGISRDFTKDEKKEEKGRIFFNTVYEQMLPSMSYYSGENSIKKFNNDIVNYKNDEKAKKRIDNYLTAIQLLPSAMVKENATIGGANTNQVYNRLYKSIGSSDIPTTIEQLETKYRLPPGAKLRAGTNFQKILNMATEKSKNIPARHTEYLNNIKVGHIYDEKTKKVKKVKVSSQDWDAFKEAGGY